jgi:hypothetical protein
MDVTFLLPTTNLTENTQDIINNSVLLPIFLVATAVKVICKYCSQIFGCDSNPCYKYFSLIPQTNLNLLI